MAEGDLRLWNDGIPLGYRGTAYQTAYGIPLDISVPAGQRDFTPRGSKKGLRSGLWLDELCLRYNNTWQTNGYKHIN